MICVKDDLIITKLCILLILSSYHCCFADIKQELEQNFAFDPVELNDLNNILLRLKEISYREAFGDRQFSHDSASDSKKDVAISDQQAKTSSKLLPYLFEGDILLSPKQANSMLETVMSKTKLQKANSTNEHKNASDAFARSRRAFSTDPEAKWIHFPIKYRFAESIEFYLISQIIQALNFWQEHTCITFKHDDKVTTGDFIQFFRGEGCYSVIGHLGGMQSISIGKGCERLGTIEHEVGHALGLWHQQSRPDAYNHIKIVEDYILKTYIGDFERRDKSEIDTYDVPYDLGSVMHYGSTAFSFDEKTRTVVTMDPYYQQTIGQREKPSFYDIKVINQAYCKDVCKGKNDCKNGGYRNPSDCDLCICPAGFGGSKCEKNETPLVYFKNRFEFLKECDLKRSLTEISQYPPTECGGMLTAKEDWQVVESPGYPDPGYDVGERCSWVITTQKDKRIEFEFVDEFSMLCTTTCVDYVELKIGSDLANTGYRFCCETADTPLISSGKRAVIIFNSVLSDDIGFKIRFRSTTKKPVTIKPTIPETTTEMTTTTVAGNNIWSEWESWSECTRPCGACGIKTRTRTCSTAHCVGKNQQFSSCNFNACKVDPRCEKIKFLNRLCGESKACSEQSSNVLTCNQPACCPPFRNVNGKCENASNLPPEFVNNTRR
uniref:Zinc metalloproteinase n=1 Tax=Syphacia muris TaxID=451379 RepID=A0A0N5AJB4_9BILA